MKKILGILAICFVGLFMLDSCGGSKNTASGIDKTTENAESTNEQTFQLLCEDCEITLKVKDRYYLVEYFTDEYIAYTKEKTGYTINYNMKIVAWDEESFEYTKEADPELCNIYVRSMFILNDFYYIELEPKQDVGLYIVPHSLALHIIADVKDSMDNDSWTQTYVVTATDYYMLRLPINEVSYTIK